MMLYPEEEDAGTAEGLSVEHADEERPLKGDLPEWKARMKRDFLDWLENFDPETAPEETSEAGPDMPDLFSLFSDLTALRQEFRTSGRRSQETLGRFETALQGFERTLVRIADGLEDLKRGSEEERRKILKPMLLSLIATLESLERLETGLSRHPSRSSFPFFRERREWTERWDGFRSAVGLTRANLEKLLQKEGVARLRTQGARFDPSCMRAVAVEAGGGGDEVLREVAPGYLLQDEVLKIADVVVGKEKGADNGRR